MSNISDAFNRAAAEVKDLPTKPDNATLLKLYALFKQGQSGDVEGKRPGMMDLKGRAKFDAWAGLKGKDSDTAMQEYVALVKTLSESSS